MKTPVAVLLSGHFKDATIDPTKSAEGPPATAASLSAANTCYMPLLILMTHAADVLHTVQAPAVEFQSDGVPVEPQSDEAPVAMRTLSRSRSSAKHISSESAAVASSLCMF